MNQLPSSSDDPLWTQPQDPLMTYSPVVEEPPPEPTSGLRTAYYLTIGALSVGLFFLLAILMSFYAIFPVAVVLAVFLWMEGIVDMVRGKKISHRRQVLLGVSTFFGVTAFIAILLFIANFKVGSLGRPFRRRGRAMKAQVGLGAGWELPEAPALTPKLAAAPLPTAPPVEPQQDLPGDFQRALAQVYREEAGAEHASIAAFSHLSLQLLALGAPPALLNSTHQAALDEIRHARAFFALASAYSKTPVGAGLFPQALLAPSAWPTDRAAQLVRLAQESVLDGCLGEGVAAALLAEGSRCAADPGLSALLASVAADEQRHTELAWDIVTWALAEGGAPVAGALQQTLARLPEVAPMPSKPPLGSALLWQAHGKVFGEKAQHLYTQTQQSVAARLTTLLSPYTADAYRQAA